MQKTLEGGALSNFPTTPDHLKVISRNLQDESENRTVAESLVNLYTEICQNRRDANVHYTDLLNMTYFLRRCAELLCLIVARWIYNTFGEEIWKDQYDHLKDVNCTNGSETTALDKFKRYYY